MYLSACLWNGMWIHRDGAEFKCLWWLFAKSSLFRTRAEHGYDRHNSHEKGLVCKYSLTEPSSAFLRKTLGSPSPLLLCLCTLLKPKWLTCGHPWTWGFPNVVFSARNIFLFLSCLRWIYHLRLNSGIGSSRKSLLTPKFVLDAQSIGS